MPHLELLVISTNSQSGKAKNVIVQIPFPHHPLPEQITYGLVVGKAALSTKSPPYPDNNV